MKSEMRPDLPERVRQWAKAGEAMERVRIRYPDLQIAGFRNGYFASADEEQAAQLMEPGIADNPPVEVEDVEDDGVR